jgi:purine nucleosidase
MSLPASKMVRVILNTDAKNEADDQYAIVQALLTPLFDLHCIMPAHFGTRKSQQSLKDSHDEVVKILDLMDLNGQVRVVDGATGAMPDEKTAADSAGARFIVEQAMKDDPRPLHVAFLGPLTDMAAAILMEPRIAQRNVRVVWIGGGAWPGGGTEYNLSNDIASANVVFQSGIEIWQIPKPLYRIMAISHAELRERVEPLGAIGKYLVDQLIAFNATRPEPFEHRSLGDSPAIGVMMYPECGTSEYRAAPEFNTLMNYEHTGRNGSVKVYTDIDQRYIHEDFYAKLARFHRGLKEFAKFDG